jgi:LysM repeat protein
LPKFKIVRSRRHGKSAIEMNYDENGKLIKINPNNSSPSDSTATITEENAVTNTTISKKTKYYVVKKGDTLYQIAKRCKTTTKRLSKLNGISTKKKLKAGQKIRLR